MATILYTPPIGESGYVCDVDWTRRHFYYNSHEGFVYVFDEDEARQFLETFKGDFKVFES